MAEVESRTAPAGLSFHSISDKLCAFFKYSLTSLLIIATLFPCAFTFIFHNRIENFYSVVPFACISDNFFFLATLIVVLCKWVLSKFTEREDQPF